MTGAGDRGRGPYGINRLYRTGSATFSGLNRKRLKSPLLYWHAYLTTVVRCAGVAPKAAMCPKCGMVFETEEELQQHLREQHPEVTSAPDS